MTNKSLSNITLILLENNGEKNHLDESLDIVLMMIVEVLQK